MTDPSAPTLAFRSSVDRCVDAITLHDESGRVRFANRATGELLWLDVADVEGADVFDVIHPADVPVARSDFAAVGAGGAPTTTTVRVQRADGSWRLVEARVANHLDDPDVASIVIATRDVTERMPATDPLTGLTTATMSIADLDRLLRAVAGDAAVAVVLVDLDRLETINETFGADSGDGVIAAVATRLRNLGAAVTGRLGGDRFLVADIVDDPRDGWRLGRRVSDAVRRPAGRRAPSLSITGSVGVAVAVPGEAGIHAVRHAAAALAAAKTRSPGAVVVFDSALRTRIEGEARLDAALRGAIAEDALQLAYQPVVCLLHGQPHAVEALLRWEHEGISIDPAALVAVAERSGTIVPLGRWVIDAATRAAAVDGDPSLRIAVNLSPIQLADPTLVKHVAVALDRNGVDGSRLTFEVTENAAVDDFASAACTLESLRALGCRIGIDDFGTGHSSLSYLRRLPVDFLKIDRSFVESIHDPSDAAIVDAITSMSAALGIEVVAEGIEHEEQRLRLIDLGCAYGQGFLFGRPVATLPAAIDRCSLLAS